MSECQNCGEEIDAGEEFCLSCYNERTCKECFDYCEDLTDDMCPACWWDNKYVQLANMDLTWIDVDTSDTCPSEERIEDILTGSFDDWWWVSCKTNAADPMLFAVRAVSDTLANEYVVDYCKSIGVLHYMTYKTKRLEEVEE